MVAEEFYKEQDVKALYDMPAGIVALKEKDLFKLMEDYFDYRLIKYKEVNEEDPHQTELRSFLGDSLYEKYMSGKCSANEILGGCFNLIEDNDTTGDTTVVS